MNKILEDYKKVIYNIEIESIGKVSEIILKFAKERKFILYGGSAIDMYLREVTKGKHFLYKEGTKIPDLDFYSGDFIKDSEDLGLLLHENGYKLVKISNGITKLTRSIKIQTEDKSVCDINYIKKSSKNMHQPILIKELGVYIASPYYLILDQFLNTFMDLYRYENRINSGFDKINAIVPVLHKTVYKTPIKNIELTPANTNLLETINLFNDSAKDLIISGDMALYWYAHGDPIAMFNYVPMFYTNMITKKIIYNLEKMLTELDKVTIKEQQELKMKKIKEKTGGELSDSDAKKELEKSSNVVNELKESLNQNLSDNSDKYKKIKDQMRNYNIIHIKNSITYYKVGKFKMVTETGLLYSYYYYKLKEKTDRYDSQINYLISNGYYKESNMKVNELEIMISPLIEIVKSIPPVIKYR